MHVPILATVLVAFCLHTRVNSLELCELEGTIASLRHEVQWIQRQLRNFILEPDLPRSCSDILKADSSAPTGEYSIKTHTGRILNKVYCEMGLNGGGYTFINPFDLTKLTDDELQPMFKDRTTLLFRARKASNPQHYGVLRQLSQYRTLPLTVKLADGRPDNARILGPVGIYFEFLPHDIVGQPRKTLGFQVNDFDLPYVKCDATNASYIALYPNFREKPSSGSLRSSFYPLYDRFVAHLKPVPSGRVMPEDYFMFMEMQHGACGLYIETDGRASARGILAVSIGFR